MLLLGINLWAYIFFLSSLFIFRLAYFMPGPLDLYLCCIYFSVSCLEFELITLAILALLIWLVIDDILFFFISCPIYNLRLSLLIA